MRNCFAHPEMEALHGKIRDGSATDEEKLKYQQLLSQHAQHHPESYEALVARAREYAGYSINPFPPVANGPIPIAPNGPLPEKDYGNRRCRSKNTSKKLAAMPYVRPIATFMSKTKGTQDKVVFYDMYPAAFVQNAASAPERKEPSKKSYHVKLIEPTKQAMSTQTTTFAATMKAFSPARGQKRVHAPVAMRKESDMSSKRQKMEQPAAAAPAKGILRQATPPSQPPTRRQPSLLTKIDPTAFLRAMRASAATRGQQEHILTAFRASTSSSSFSSSSSSNDSRRSAFESLQQQAAHTQETRSTMSASNPSRPIKQAFVQHTSRSFASQRPATTPSPPAKRSQSSPTKYASYSKAKKAFSPQASIASPPALRKELAPPAPKPFLQPAEKIQALPTEKPRSPRSFEEETKMRRLAGMQSTTAILTQTLPPHLMKKAIKSNPHMSTTHLLRRFGNPHRRVVHQMLRDQNEKIIREMKKMQLITAKSSDTSQKQDSKPVQVTNVAVESK